jgi:hypothetical protein
MTLTTLSNTIILHFPQRMWWGGWMDLEALHDSFKRGGFPAVSRKDVTNALKGLTKDRGIHVNKVGCRRFHALVQPGEELQHENAKDQHSVVGSGKQARINPGCFLLPF